MDKAAKISRYKKHLATFQREAARWQSERDTLRDVASDLDKRIISAEQKIEELEYSLDEAATKQARQKIQQQINDFRKLARGLTAEANRAERDWLKAEDKYLKAELLISTAKNNLEFIEHGTVMGMKVNPAKKRNYTHLNIIGEASRKVVDGVHGWKVGARFFPKGAGTAHLTGTKYLDLKSGMVYARRKANPKQKNVAGYIDEQGRFRPIRHGSDEYSNTRVKYSRKKAGESVSPKKRKPAKKAAKKAVKKAAGKSAKPVTKKRNIAGFRDDNGTFHPIRSGSGYDEGRVGHQTRSKKRRAAAAKASQTARMHAEKKRKSLVKSLASRSLAARTATGTRLKKRNKTTINIRARHVDLTRGTHNPKRSSAANAARQGREIFVGRASRKSFVADAPNGTPKEIYELGRLMLIVADGRKYDFSTANVKLCAAPGGRQLYVVGSGYRFTHPGDSGKITRIEYEAAKSHIGDGRKAVYFHRMGEENGRQPSLYIDKEGLAHFKGGDYYITSAGIHN